MHNRDMVDLHLRWLQRTNERPLVQVFAPVQVPFGGLDIDVPPDQIASRKAANAQIENAVPGDRLHVQRINFGPALLPALAGAGFEYDAHTSWNVPVFEDADDLTVRPFDPEHPLWQEYEKRFLRLLEGWSWDSYLPGHSDLLGPMDILAGLMGPENLAMALYAEPDAVKTSARDAAQLLLDCHAREVALLREAGVADGVTDCFSVWLPGRGLRYSEDFSALCGEVHFREFFLEPNTLVCRALDTIYLHTHSAALACLPAMLDLPLSVIEIGNDPNGPPVPALVEAGRKVLERGIALQMSNWERHLSREQIDLYLNGLPPQGLRLTLQAHSLEEATELYAYASGRRDGVRAG